MDIIELIKAHQLNIMLVMSGVCATLAALATFTGALSPQRRRILCLLELAATVLLLSDRFAYIYRGDVSQLGFWMVRICNFLVYLCSLILPLSVTLYLWDLYHHEGKLERVPLRLRAAIAIAIVGIALIVVSQFTGLYYTFDEMNQYQRSAGSIISYIPPTTIVVLLLTVLYDYRRLIGRRLTLALTLNLLIPIIASFIQLFVYGISLTNIAFVGMAILLYNSALRDLNESLEQARISEIEIYKEARRKEHTLFEQTAEALVSAIDAKDEYTRGHSARVAMYSELIAVELGMSDEECERVYFAALLHDVGKIGIADAIINKDGRLTDEEFEQIKLHPVLGNQILSSIHESPYLSVGAHYHHERYDGRGYPDGLAGKDIPQIARIIGVADAYDAMTSKRSYRDLRPQHLVREELLKGMGTQFDPYYARIMLHYMDLDQEYLMHEQLEGQTSDLIEGLNTEFETEVRCDSHLHDCSTGIRVIDTITRISFVCTRDEGYAVGEALPFLILFDSLDGLVHESEKLQKDRRYFEYARIGFDRSVSCTEARKAEVMMFGGQGAVADWGTGWDGRSKRFDIEAARYRDHVQLRIADQAQTMQVVLALPFSGRFSYLSLTGEHCTLSSIRVERTQRKVGADYIRRIAERVSYIRDCPVGDIPNIQIEGARADTSQGIPVVGRMRLRFHAQSLPNARLVWHCPYLVLYTSSDGTVTGDDYQEFVLVRLNGEELVDNALSLHEDSMVFMPDFAGWPAFVEALHAGIDCEVAIERKGRTVSLATENLGIAAKSVATIPIGVEDVYIAFTGDQCAVSDVHAERLG